MQHMEAGKVRLSQKVNFLQILFPFRQTSFEKTSGPFSVRRGIKQAAGK
jgi:hypothetical protein